MISAWWLVPALMLGAFFGVLLIAIVNSNKGGPA